jgi:CysZ protein
VSGPVHSLGIGSGLDAFAGGVSFILTTPRVWGYALVPAVLLVGLFSGFLVLGIWEASRTTAALLGEPIGLWGRISSWGLMVALSLVALLVSAVLALTLTQPLSSFALERVVHAQERALTGVSPDGPGLLTSMLRTAWVSGVTLLVGGTVLAALLVVNFFFPPALIVTVPLKFLVCAWLLAWDFLDYPWGLRRLGIATRLGWVGRHFDAFTTFGLAWALLIVIPGTVLVILPMGVAGATRLVIESERP